MKNKLLVDYGQNREAMLADLEKQFAEAKTANPSKWVVLTFYDKDHHRYWPPVVKGEYYNNPISPMEFDEVKRILNAHPNIVEVKVSIQEPSMHY